MKTIVVTGAAGFIGSALCRYLRGDKLARVIGIDNMTYAANRASLDVLESDIDFELVEADINNATAMAEVFRRVQPDGIMHLAAETHVDRSIDTPGKFIETNIAGTFSLLEVTRQYLAKAKKEFRFLHVSTDEVYGSLGETGSFSEATPYAPNSPYAASKAAADHLVRAWHATYGVPVITTNCSNNYGPYQFPEKLIPLITTKALNGEKLPIYGHGINVRDWLYVEDHVEALFLIFNEGRVGDKYHIGGASERRNIDVVYGICAILDELVPLSFHRPHRNLVTFVPDRPGHDERYAMNFDRLRAELGWRPSITFEEGLKKTVSWYLANRAWSSEIRANSYAGERLGQLKSA